MAIFIFLLTVFKLYSKLNVSTTNLDPRILFSPSRILLLGWGEQFLLCPPQKWKGFKGFQQYYVLKIKYWIGKCFCRFQRNNYLNCLVPLLKQLNGVNLWNFKFWVIYRNLTIEIPSVWAGNLMLQTFPSAKP